MADEVKIPGIKQPLPKPLVFVGLGGVGIAIVIYYRNKKNQASQQPAATSTDQYPPDGTVGDPTDPYSTDPATGQTYGDEAVGSGGTFGAFGGLGGTGGSGWDPNTGLYTDPNGNTCTNPDGSGYCPGSSGGGPPFSTNQAWASYAEQQLADSTSGSPGALAAALGLYLAGQEVDPAQVTLIYEAQGVAGPVPVAGPGGYPPNIKTNGHKGGGQLADNPVKGLKAEARYTQADLRWEPSNHATSYRVIVKKGHTRVQTQNLTGTSITLHDLKRKTDYDVQVLALPTKTYNNEAHTSFKTK